MKKQDRKATRFQPDPMTLALVDLKPTREFKPTLTGIVLNESYTGCAILVASDLPFKKASKLRIKVGQLEPLKGQIAWIKHLEENIYKIGVRLLE